MIEYEIDIEAAKEKNLTIGEVEELAEICKLYNYMQSEGFVEGEEGEDGEIRFYPAH